MDIKGVIFDLDGTLVHTLEDIADSANKMLVSNGFPLHEIPRYLEWIGSGASRLIEQAAGRPLEASRLKAMVTEFKETYGENLHEKSRLYDGIPAVLDAMTRKGIPMAILSNKPHLLTLKVAEYYLSAWPFNPVLGQREEVPRKPDPAAAFEIADRMGSEPGKILFVGDSGNDILTARAAGMIPLGVSWGYGSLETGEEKQDVLIINRPSELMAFFAHHNE
jgi:phosphoglycolate phosphatase